MLEPLSDDSVQACPTGGYGGSVLVAQIKEVYVQGTHRFFLVDFFGEGLRHLPEVSQRIVSLPSLGTWSKDGTSHSKLVVRRLQPRRVVMGPS